MTSTCNFKREPNQKPILPLCKFDKGCTDFRLEEHRKKFYHSTFGFDNNKRLNYLLKSSAYSHSKKTENPGFSGMYLWEQFICDFEKNPQQELHRSFVFYSYFYIIQNLDRISIDDYSAIYQALMILEEMNITGIHYLNKAFLLWIFKKDSLYELSFILKDFIEKQIIYSYYDIHFSNILNLIKHTNDSSLNIEFLQIVKGVKSSLTLDTLKQIYSEFMLGNTFKLTSKQRELKEQELEIISFQKQMKSKEKNLIAKNFLKQSSEKGIDILNFSNTGLVRIIDIIIENKKVNVEDIKRQHYNLSVY